MTTCAGEKEPKGRTLAIGRRPLSDQSGSSSLRGAAWLVCFAVLASLRAYPQSSEAQARAEQALRSGQFQVAADAYATLVRQQPKSAELWSNLGAAQALGGNCEQALPALEKARSLNPALFTPWYFSGFCHVEVHANEQALDELKRAVSLKPRDANAWYFLAQAAGNLDQLGVAFDAVVRSVALDAQRPEAYYAAAKTSLDLATECYSLLKAGTESSVFIYRLEGERDSAQGVWDAAVAALEKAAQLKPHDSDIPYVLGTTYLKAEKLPQSEAAFRKCLELAPNSALARLGLARALAKEGKRPEAKKILESISLEHLQAKEEFEELLACADLLEVRELADRALRQWSTRFPGDPGPAAWRSRAASDPATPATRDAPLVEPRIVDVASAVRFLAISNPPTGNVLAAAFPSPVQYREFRAALLRDDLVGMGQLMAARSKVVPSEPAQVFVLGETLHWLSYRFYEDLERKFPDSVPAQMFAAESFSNAGQQDKALEIYQGILAKDGSAIDLLYAIAQIYWTQHRWDDALRTLQDLMQLDPRDATLYVNAGRIYWYRQDLANAERNFEQAVKVDPSKFEAHLGLGETYRREGREEEAVRELQAASHAEPDNPRPHYELSQIYRKAERKDLAQEEMETFERLQGRSQAARERKERKLVPLE